MPKDKDQGSVGDKNRGKTPRNDASRPDPESCCLAPENYVAIARRNIVVRDVRDRNGISLGTIVAPHDGTVAGIVAAAQVVTDRMYADYPDASNIESRIGATDKTGKPKWSISPNFNHLAEIGTDEAANIWGDLTARTI
jgi:hypothetical protein